MPRKKAEAPPTQEEEECEEGELADYVPSDADRKRKLEKLEELLSEQAGEQPPPAKKAKKQKKRASAAETAAPFDPRTVYGASVSAPAHRPPQIMRLRGCVAWASIALPSPGRTWGALAGRPGG
jgi:hypothetical protein